MKYRAEIDGLRAIAVVPVILFHAGFELFSGGFVGVDVFFVISGYLITTILMEDIESNRFNLINFYERRARRILPALLVVMLACIPFSWMWMRPDQMEDFSQSLIAVSAFASNFLFWQESGYFDLAAEQKPLLHTWSLGVEEQYYLVFPIFLIMAWRFGKSRVFWTIVVISTLSLALSEWSWRSGRTTANFYLAPTRAWELLAGSIAAFAVQKHGVQSSNTLSALGLAAVVFAILAYDQGTPFPGLYALVPVIGVVLIVLFADSETWVAKLLGTKGLVGIGLISYSAYLWHQPLFAFARIQHVGGSPNPALMLLLGAASLVLGYVSYKYIEQPFRDKSRIARKQILAFSGGAILVPLSLGFLFVNLDRSTLFEVENPLLMSDTAPSEYWISEPCADFVAHEGNATCNRSIQSEGIKVVLWGDSHALVMEDAAPPVPGVELLTIIHIGCPPLLDVVRFDRDETAINCNKYDTMRKYLDWINAQNPDVVILVGRWSLYINGWYRNGEAQSSHHFLKDTVSDEAGILGSIETRKEVLFNAFSRTVASLNATHIAILDQPVDYGMIELSEVATGQEIPQSRTQDFNAGRYDVLNRISNVELLTVNDIFCQTQNCATKLDNVLLYHDDNHLTRFAAGMVWKAVLEPYISGLK